MNEEKSTFKIPVLLLWALAIISWVLTLDWIIYLNSGYESIVFSAITLTCMVVTLLVFIVDIAISDIFNKPAWFIMVIFTPQITFLIYLLQKKRLLRIQKRVESFTQR